MSGLSRRQLLSRACNECSCANGAPYKAHTNLPLHWLNSILTLNTIHSYTSTPSLFHSFSSLEPATTSHPQCEIREPGQESPRPRMPMLLGVGRGTCAPNAIPVTNSNLELTSPPLRHTIPHEALFPSLARKRLLLFLLFFDS